MAVLSLIFGQGLLFGNIRVLEYGIAVWVAFYFFVLIYEEPTLRKTFGREYEEFCANVPRLGSPPATLAASSSEMSGARFHGASFRPQRLGSRKG